MSWVLPSPLLILAGGLGFAPALPRVERPTGNMRLMAEAFAVAALTCLGFAAAWGLWWVERRR